MPLFRRAGRPGLIGTAARTAVIAGTAQATAGAVAARQQRRAEERAMAAAPPPVQAAPPAPAAPPAQAAATPCTRACGVSHPWSPNRACSR
jgi:hypothetical protein